MRLPNIKNANVKGKRVLVRVDMNVPLGRNGKIFDDFRIRQSLPTIQWILGHGGHVVLLTHRGLPLQADPSPAFSAAPIARHLGKLLGIPVHFVRNPMKEKPNAWTGGKVIFLENLRFWPGEENNSKKFVEFLARWGELYVNDAFAESHRKAASIIGLPKILPAYAGLLLEKEAASLAKIFSRLRRPFLVIIGGAKISTKIRSTRSFLKRADHVAVGGAIFNTILAAAGENVGRSIVEKNAFGIARSLKNAKNIILPKDVKVLHRPGTNVHTVVRSVDDVGKNDYICDIGPAAVAEFTRYVKKARTILWSGPLGQIEFKSCRSGSVAIARMLAKSKAVVVIGGGDLEALWREEKISVRRVYASTGGGALLNFVVHGSLPGIEALQKYKRDT